MKLHALALCGIALSSLAGAESFFASTTKLGYTGTVSVFNTLKDALAGTNQRGGPYTIAQRDAELYTVLNRPSFNQNMNILQTNVWYTTADNTNGFEKDDPRGDQYYFGKGNPSWTANSFVEMRDAEGHTTTSATGRWTNTNYDTFSLNMSGAWNPANAQGVGGRFWAAGQPTEVMDSTLFGQYLNWNLQVTVTGLQGKDLDGDGFFESTNQPGSISGTFSGIFENRSSFDPAPRGFYKFNINLTDINWAWNQGDAALNGNFLPSRFGASAVPEPGTLCALGLGAIALLRKRRKNA